jgi:hypothetical protein
MPKGKIILVPAGRKLLTAMDGATFFRQGGMIKVHKVYDNKVDYYFTNDPTTILTTSTFKGFYTMAVMIPEYKDESRWMPIRPSEIPAAEKFLVKGSNNTYDLTDNRYKTTLLHVFIDERNQVVLDNRRLVVSAKIG